MAGTCNPRPRIDRLTEAIHSCQSLTRLLCALGSSSPSEWTESESSQRICDLEGALGREIQSLLEARNGVLAPVTRLTDDILRLIFLEYHEQCLRERWDTSKPPSSKVSSSFSITSICRQWRSVALQTAPLWSDVTLYAPYTYQRLSGTCPEHPAYGPQNGHIIKPRDKLRLERSASTGLDVSIKIQLASSYVPLVAQRFRESCSGRVKTLNLRTDSHDETEEGAEHFRTDLQMFSDCVRMSGNGLAELHFAGGSRRSAWRGTLDKELNAFFSISLPHLKEVSLRDIPFPATPTFSGLSECRHLTITTSLFTRSNLTSRGCLRLLQACPKLRYVSLERVELEAEADRETVAHSIHLPYLHSVHVAYSNRATRFTYPFLYLRAPTLRDLSVVCLNGLPDESNRSPDVLSPILRMFEASPFKLNSLLLSGLSFVHVRAMGPLIRSLTHVKIDFGAGTAEDLENFSEYRNLVEFLAAPDAEEPTCLICPQLTSLDFPCSALQLLEDILTMVEARRSRGTPIEYLELARWSLPMHLLETQPEERAVLEYAAALEEKIGCAVGHFWIGSWRYNARGKKWDLHKGIELLRK